jgi:hypothetical protein
LHKALVSHIAEALKQRGHDPLMEGHHCREICATEYVVAANQGGGSDAARRFVQSLHVNDDSKVEVRVVETPSTTRSEEDATTGKIPTRRRAGKFASALDLSPNGMTRTLRIASNVAIQRGCRPANARRAASGASSLVFRTSIANASLKSADGNTLAQSVGGGTAIGRTAGSMRSDFQ